MNIEDLENDVIDFASEILNLCAKDSGLDEVFLGTQIFFSPMVYDADIMFSKLNDISTDEGKREYLKNYNLQNKTLLYWSFLDDEEMKELDKIEKTNRKIYSII